MIIQLGPVWISLVVLFVISMRYKRSLGLYGKLFDSVIGMIGFDADSLRRGLGGWVPTKNTGQDLLEEIRVLIISSLTRQMYSEKFLEVL